MLNETMQSYSLHECIQPPLGHNHRSVADQIT